MEIVLLTIGVVLAAVGAAFAHDRINQLKDELLTYKEKNTKVLNRLCGDKRFEIGYFGDLIDNNEKEYL